MRRKTFKRREKSAINVAGTKSWPYKPIRKSQVKLGVWGVRSLELITAFRQKGGFAQ